jgi:peptide chain release factor subunit 1
VTTCYLDVEARQLAGRHELGRGFTALAKRVTGDDGKAPAPSVADDLARMERHVKAGFGRSGVRGLAMFSCSSAGWWEVHELPVRVTDQLVVQEVPAVRQMEEIVSEYERFGVLLVDRQRARMLVFHLGQIEDRSELFDQLERGSEDSRDLVKTRQAHRADEQLSQHLKRAAQVAFEVQRRHGFERLLVGGPTDVVAELERHLHPWLRERLADRLHISVSASDDQVRTAALEVERQLERRNQAALVQRLREDQGAGRAVVGLAATLQALGDHRADVVLVAHGYSAEGWRCDGCGCLSAMGRRCARCGAEMVKVPDVVEDAVHHALAQGCRVQTCIGNADLDVVGRIGALLRY